MIEDLEVAGFPYPAIDFRFVNRGGASAILSSIGIELLNASPDLQPELTFTYSVANGALTITSTNSGWGDATALRMMLCGWPLEEIFSEQELSFDGLVQSGKSRVIHRLNFLDATRREFVEKLQAERLGAVVDLAALSDASYWPLREADGLLGRSESGFIEIPEVRVNGYFTDCSGREHEFSSDVRVGNPGLGFYRLYLASRGFYLDYSPVLAMMMPPETVYVTVLDPMTVPCERRYAVSRVIPSGDAERFHVVVGATRSAALEIRLNFYFDGNATISSDRFNIKVVRPSVESGVMNSNRLFFDGDVFGYSNGVWRLRSRAKRE
jgi:hypothetical protein